MGVLLFEIVVAVLLLLLSDLEETRWLFRKSLM